MVYTTFSTLAKYHHLNIYVYFFNFERVISLYETHTAI